MSALMYVVAVICWLLGIFMLMSVASDIQLGFGMVLLAIGFVALGQAQIIQRQP
jgi:hypothetical protein